MYQNFIGIDIAKDDFVVALFNHKEILSFTNNPDGFSCFQQRFKSILSHSLVVLETTGAHELALIRYLQQHQYPVHRANTRKVKHFIRSLGKLGKSDAIDAAGLARYGAERHHLLPLFQENPRKKLLKLVMRRTELKQMLVQEKNRRQAPDMDILQESFNTVIKALEQQLNLLESQIKAICADDPELTLKINTLKTIAGVGEITAFSLVAVLPELGTLNRKQVAALAGVAPHPNESGNSSGRRYTRGGRSEVKPILFMAAMTAARSNSELGQFYQKLVNAGKKKIVGIVALMRKIVVIADARVRDAMQHTYSST